MSGYFNYIKIEIRIEIRNWKLEKNKLEKNQIGNSKK